MKEGPIAPLPPELTSPQLLFGLCALGFERKVSMYSRMNPVQQRELMDSEAAACPFA